jgi:hypothetical protein
VPEPPARHEEGVDPEHEAVLADSVGLAFMVVLDTLGPAERLAFVRNGASDTTADMRALTPRRARESGRDEQRHGETPRPHWHGTCADHGGASGITISRPPGVEVSIRLKGWAAHLTFDDQSYEAIGTDGRLQSPSYADATRRYDIEVEGGASAVTVTAIS